MNGVDTTVTRKNMLLTKQIIEPFFFIIIKPNITLNQRKYTYIFVNETILHGKQEQPTNFSNTQKKNNQHPNQQTATALYVFVHLLSPFVTRCVNIALETNLYDWIAYAVWRLLFGSFKVSFVCRLLVCVITQIRGHTNTWTHGHNNYVKWNIYR